VQSAGEVCLCAIISKLIFLFLIAILFYISQIAIDTIKHLPTGYSDNK
jgi:hypothetical protein